jgi:hypothetical protein
MPHITNAQHADVTRANEIVVSSSGRAPGSGAVGAGARVHLCRHNALRIRRRARSARSIHRRIYCVYPPLTMAGRASLATGNAAGWYNLRPRGRRGQGPGGFGLHHASARSAG